jgi:hypothetical protein
MSAAMAAPSVAAEFLGLARTFRNGVDMVDPVAIAAVDTIARSLRARLRRRQKMTASVEIAMDRQWRATVPAIGRLALETRVEARSLHIRELRLSSSRIHDKGWRDGDWEAGICINVIGLVADHRKFRFNSIALASLNLHAIGRRYQRGLDNSPAAIVSDLRSIADVAAEVAETDGNFEINVAGGVWAGHVMEIRDEDGRDPTKILSIRTFLPAEEN